MEMKDFLHPILALKTQNCNGNSFGELYFSTASFVRITADIVAAFLNLSNLASILMVLYLSLQQQWNVRLAL